MNEWIEKARTLKTDRTNLIDEYATTNTFEDDNVGVENQVSGGVLKLLPDGRILLRTSNNVGITIHEKMQNIALYGNTVLLNANAFRLSVNDYGFGINGNRMNPSLYKLAANKNLTLHGTIDKWIEATDEEPGYWTRTSVAIRPFYTEDRLRQMGVIK
jgi:hypothetical protein